MQKEIDIFENYISNYDLNIPELYKKKKHTYRVVEFAKEIASSINLSEDDTNKACICALFHDLGRFPQFSKYKTFQDAISIDHGDKSYEILKELNYNDQDVLSAVKYHNKYSVPQNLSDSEKLFANITRDADKLDILFEQLNDEYSEDYKIADNIMKYFIENRLIENKLNENETIIRLRQLTFLFDINFKKSYEILKQSNIIDKKIDIIYDAIKDEKIFKIRDILNERIEEKC